MLLLRLLRFLSGYVKITVSGRFPERFLNICASRGMSLWYSHRRGEYIECCMFARDYKKAASLRRDCGVKLKIKRRYGLPFALHRYRRRKGLLCGAAIFAAFLFVMPQFVWSIDINSDFDIPDAKVLDALSDIGLTIGTPVSRIDTGNMRVQLALELPEVSWVSINTDATKVTVDIRKTTTQDQADERFCNIVASADGRITALYVRDGNAAVKVGDAVVKGQMLVSGTMEYKDGSTVFCHSDADVMALCEHELKVSVPLEQTVTVDTGKVSRRRVLSAFGLKVPLYLGEINFQYRSKAEMTPLVIGGVELPAWTAYADFYEVAERSVTLSREAAERQCLERLERLEATELAGAKIESRDLSYTESDGKLNLTARYTCTENIAQIQYFDLTNE